MCCPLLIHCLLSGALLVLASTTDYAASLAWVALLPACAYCGDISRTYWVVCGLLVGLLWSAVLLPGLMGWGVGYIAAGSVLMSLSAGLNYLLSSCVYSSSGLAFRVFSFPAGWTLGTYVMEELGGVPLCISVLLPADKWAPASVIGQSGLDFLILSVAGVAGEALRRGRTVALLTIAATLLVATASLPASGRSGGLNVKGSEVTRQVFIIQPSVPINDFRSAVGVSHIRRRIEFWLDELSRRAVDSGPALIVWPEGSNGLLNLRIPRRIKAMTELLLGGESELLIGTADLLPDGTPENVVAHITSDGYTNSAPKARPVPFAEAKLGVSDARVLRTGFGNAGVLVCFDALFSQLAPDLVLAGAQIIVIVADDSSFGLSALPHLHAKYAALRAVENGRPVVFASNMGPSMIVDHLGGIVAESQFGQRRALGASVLLPETQTVYVQGGRYIAILAAMLVLLARILHEIRRI